MSDRVVCFGEILIRLSAPSGELLLQSQDLRVCFGGAEANVAVSLAHLGNNASMVSVLPDNALGHAALGELRRHGVDGTHIRCEPGRMGLYFVTPAGSVRAAEVLYDRAHSAFADAKPELIDWDAALAGAAWLHISGVTPALGPNGAAAAERAAREARRLGVKVSFDGNYRARLWAAWKGDAQKILRDLIALADVAFVDERDIALVLQASFDGDDPLTRRAHAARAAFATFPNLQRIAATLRTSAGGEDQLSADLFSRTAEFRAPAIPLGRVVDRIGSGDAFAAGVLHGLIHRMADHDGLQFGLAAAALKHSIAGDFNLASAADISDLLKGEHRNVRR